MLEIRNFSAKSGDREILSPLDLTLGPGITALLGPSGCGKSTLLRWLAGVPLGGLTCSGEARLEGYKAPLPLAWMPQGDSLLPWANVLDNAALPLELAGVPRRLAREEVRALLPEFGLEGCADLRPAQLSGGMKQRLAFLRASLQKAPLLLLDEPFSALDAITRLKMQDWLRGYICKNNHISLLLVTHDLYEASRLADRILVLSPKPGRILADLTPPPSRSETALAALRDQLTHLLLT